MEQIIKNGLLIYLLLNFSLTFVLPSIRVWKKTGIMPITFGKSDNAHDFIGFIFKILLVILLGIGVVYTFFPNTIYYLTPMTFIENNTLKIIGLCILTIALLWIIVAQQQMSNSWRIGIDESNKTALVTSGIFAISRNPIFLGMISTLLGVFLLIPSAITFMIVVTGTIVVQIQVRLEEEFLQQSHGKDYNDYCKKTRRWM